MKVETADNLVAQGPIEMRGTIDMPRNGDCGPGSPFARTLSRKAGEAAFFLLLVTSLLSGTAVGAGETTSRLDANPGAADAQSLGEYRLTLGDRVSIVVFEQSELSGDFALDGAGQILLPLAGLVKVGGLTLLEAQQLIQQRFSDGVLVHPVVSLRIREYRPIFVTGDVRNPGSYPFQFGQSVKAAIAAAGGHGRASPQHNMGMADFVLADERVRVLETSQRSLLVREARLMAQRDGASEFEMPRLAALDVSSTAIGRIYAAENDNFHRLTDSYHAQIQVLEQQRPRLEAEMKAVTEQMAKERERLVLANERVVELEDYKRRGLARSQVFNDQQREEARIESEVWRLQARVARLTQDMGDIEVRVESLKGEHNRRILADLHEVQQRLREIEVTLESARELREVRAQDAGGIDRVEHGRVILITRTGESGAATFKATTDTLLGPGDVVEIKRERVSSEHIASAIGDSCDPMRRFRISSP